MDVEKLIEELKKAGILENVQRKRLTTSEMPAALYIKLIAASIATKKNLSGVMATALETYTMRNSDKHLDELKLQAAAAGKTVEEYLVDAIAQRLKKDE